MLLTEQSSRSCATTGQTVPDDIVMANYPYITKLMLEERHELEYKADVRGEA